MLRVASPFIVAQFVAALAGCAPISSDGGSDGPDADATGGRDEPKGGAVAECAQVEETSNDAALEALEAHGFTATEACALSLPVPLGAIVDGALALDGAERCGFGLTDADVAAAESAILDDASLFDVRRTEAFDALYAHPLGMPAHALALASELDRALDPSEVGLSLAAMSRALSLPAGASQRACVDPASPATDPRPLASAIRALFASERARDARARAPRDAHSGAVVLDEVALDAMASALPHVLQTRIAPLVRAIDAAAGEVDEALGTRDPKERALLAQAAMLARSFDGPFRAEARKGGLYERVDVARMAAAAAALARAIGSARLEELRGVHDATGEEATSLSAFTGRFELDTPLGAIVIAGTGADHHEESSLAARAALLIDLGGDDLYKVPAGASGPSVPVAIAIDVSGHDRYGYRWAASPWDAGLLPSDDEGRYAPSGGLDDWGPITLSRTARQGAGAAGIGMLFDLGAGRDVYQSLANSQGLGSAGVGVLFDDGGDDLYEAEVLSQGAATYGLGLLIDVGGRDRFASFHASQGFGGVRGVGALVDGQGDDIYFLDPGIAPGHALYFASQLPGGANASHGQGAGAGRRPEFLGDPDAFAGGLGVLRDRDGADVYEAGVFAQGSGYWQGAGMLVDGSGNDTYGARWYAQAASAHLGAAVLVDERGDDRYDATLSGLGTDAIAASLGFGNDYGASVFADLAGNDRYRAPLLSLGTGMSNGVGVFLEAGGDDRYQIAADPTLGAATYSPDAITNGARTFAPTYGLFVDASGADQYVVGGAARPLDGTAWSHETLPAGLPLAELRGRGIDR